MKRTLVRHRRDAVALIVMTVIAVSTLSYILARQVAFTLPSWLPGVEEPYRVEVEFTTASGIIPGQAQPVTVAGVQVGDVAGLEVEDGRAVVTLEIEPKYAPVYANATALLRPRTPLKEMFVALDPGTEKAPPIPDGGRIPASQTKPDVPFDEILANLDTDTRAYLRLLLVSGGDAFTDDPSKRAGDGEPSPGAVTDLRAALKRFEPLIHHTHEIGAALGERRRNLQRVITSFSEIAGRMASVQTDLATLISASNRTFAATASRDADLADALGELPPTLAQTDSTLRKTTAFADQLGPTLADLRPFASSLGPTLEALQPFLEQTTPIIRDQLRPFSREVRPVVNDLRPAAASLAGGVATRQSGARVLQRPLRCFRLQPDRPRGGLHVLGSLAGAHRPLARRPPGFLRGCPALAPDGDLRSARRTAPGRAR